MLGIVAACVAAGVGYARWVASATRAHVTAQLTAVAELKSGDIGKWYKERLGDARAIMRLPYLAESILSRRPTREEVDKTEPLLRTYLNQLRESYGYQSVALFDRELRPIVGQPENATTPDAPASSLLNEARRSRDVVVGDLRRLADGNVCLDVVAPLISNGGGFAGAVWLQVNADSSLFPFLRSWPYPSTTAESILLRREADEIVFLSPLRHRSLAPLTLRLPLTQPGLLAARPFLSPSSDSYAGVDYRGVAALAVIRPVPGTTWLVVAKMDDSEAFSDARYEIVLANLSLVLVLALAGLATAYVWRRQHQVLIERERQAELGRLEASAQLAVLMRHANDAILLFDAEKLNVVEANDRATAMYGYSSQEWPHITVRDVRTPGEDAATTADLAKARTSQGHIFETVHRRKDGTTFPVEVSSRVIEIGDRKAFLSIIRDISERKVYERQLARLNRMYVALTRVNEAIFRATDWSELAQGVCRILVEVGGFKLAWIGWPSATGTVEQLATFGDETSYLDGIQVSVDDSSEGQGPIGRAFREGRTIVINDFITDARLAPWHERALRAGVASAMALPLRRRGIVVGTIQVYSGERNAFGKREVALAEEVASDLSYALDVLAADEERQRALAALEESESRLRLLVSATPAIIYTCRASDWATTFVSDNVGSVLGFQPSDFLTNREFWTNQIHPDDRNEALASGQRLTSGQPTIREYRFRHRDGGYRWMRDEARLVLDTDGRPTMIAGCWIDVTARRLAEEALRAREEIFSNIAEQSNDSIALVEPTTGHFVEFNEATHRNLGYTREEFANFRIGDIQAEHSPEQIRANIERIHAAGSVAFETRHRHRNGEIRDVYVRAAQLRLHDKAYMAAVWTDITERKRAEEALRRSEASLEMAQSIAGLGNWDLDPTTGSGSWSKEMFLLFDRDPAGPVPSFDEFLAALDPADRIRVVAAQEKTLATGEPTTFELIFTPRGRAPRTFEARVDVIAADGGSGKKLAGTVLDITERKRAEQEILDLNANLERRIVERTAELVDANRELEAFSYSVSHDLRSPLLVIDGYSKALQEDCADQLDDNGRDCINEILKATVKMSDLIDGLLTLSRATRGDLDRVPVDLSALTEEVRRELERAEPARSGRWIIEPGMVVEADQRMLGVVMRNLLGNAWKFTARCGDPEIRVFTEDHDGQRFICVADNGAGFDMTYAGRLFDTFQRLHTQSEFPGIGIGLATVHRIIKRHGGQIEANGEPGRGATFRFSLPGAGN